MAVRPMASRQTRCRLPARHKPAKDAMAIMATPIMKVAVAMLIATGFVSATKAIKRPRRIRINAERKTTFLVIRLIVFSNGTRLVELWPAGKTWATRDGVEARSSCAAKAP